MTEAIVTKKRSLLEIITERKQKELALLEATSLAKEPLRESEPAKIVVEAPVNPTTIHRPSLKELMAQKSNKIASSASMGTDSFIAAITVFKTKPTKILDTLISNKKSLRDRLAIKQIGDLNKVVETGEAEATLSLIPRIPTTISTKSTIDTLIAASIPVNTDKMTTAQVAEAVEIAENLRKIESSMSEDTEDTNEYKGAFSLDIQLNTMQLMAKDMAFAGKSFCLIGAAGTGKTTAQREIARELLRSKCLSTHSFRIQGTGERVTAPSIAFVAYTRIAAGNLARAIHKLPELKEVLQYNITTIHNLLEYTPVTYWDDTLQKEVFRFEPKRTRGNPLDITHLVIEESSMLGLDPLWYQLFAALRPGVQIIFIGDINQLPPVFGDSILNYALVQLPVVELTHVYRQADGSSILNNAHKILAGEMVEEHKDFRLIKYGEKNHTQAKLSASLGMTFPKWMDLNEYDPNTDIILSPWNKRELGTDNMNKWIAQFLGTKRNAIVYQIIAGTTTCYLALGDKVMYNKRVGVVTRIAINGRYMGKQPLPCSANLNRFGTYTGNADETLEDLESMDYSNLNLDAMLEDTEGDITKEASHIIEISLDDGGTEVLSGVGDYAASTFSLAYALTIHKAQGCEWRKVYLILHRDHAVSLCREMLYTAVTRAREQIVIIAKEEIILKAITTQRIKGNTLKEKIEYFNSGVKLNNAVVCTK